MSTGCCFAAYEPAMAKGTHFYPTEVGRGETCQMATGANCDDKMADDERTRALDYIREMCLDRPCPSCKSEGIDKPQDDLRQCRACGHVWGFDDTQNLEEFVREFGRMQPCTVCGSDGLDEFEVVENRGRQELICLNCQTVQDTYRREQNRNIQDFDVIQMDEEGYGDSEPDLPNRNPARHARELSCPFCPEMTYDFFVKEFDCNELVRVVCPGCSYVVFYKDQENGISSGRAREIDFNYRREHEVDWKAWKDGKTDRRRTDEKPEKQRKREDADDNDEVQLYPPVKKVQRYLTVKPIELVRRTLQGCAESGLEEDGLLPRLATVVSTRAPIVGEQWGWTVGTAVGNIVFKNAEGAACTGTVGSIVGRRFCEMVLKGMRGRKI